jgi:DNA-binding HxlR family transcriptional regulator
LSRQVYPEIPPHTEYALTENGKKLAVIIAQLQSLDNDIRSTADHKQSFDY